MDTTKGWAIKHTTSRASWLCYEVHPCRRGAIGSYVAIWGPVGVVPDWHSRSVTWKWRWLKRRYGVSVVKVEIRQL